MSAIDLSGECGVCKDFLEYDYSIYDIQTRCKEMVRQVELHRNHYKSVHERSRKQYAFTFTTNADTGLEEQKTMCEAAYRLMLQKTTPVRQAEVYLEYTEEKRPHLHGWYETEDGGRIFAKTFRRCWPRWGEKARQTHFAGGFHELMKTERYKGYSSSEGRLVVSKQIDADPVYHVTTAETWDA